MTQAALPNPAAALLWRHAGTLLVKDITVTPRPSFLEYISGGIELNFIVSVDYTASNGDPRDPNSLHHYSQRPTMYEGVWRWVRMPNQKHRDIYWGWAEHLSCFRRCRCHLGSRSGA